jgi:hypothetical protein
MAKRELRLWLKTKPDSHVVKHQESKLKNLLKRERIFWETTRAQHMCVLAKVDTLLFWKKYRRGQDQCSYASRRFSRASWPASATRTAMN